MPQESPSAPDLASEILLVLGGDPQAGSVGSTELFRRCNRDQLLDCAKRLRLTKVARLTKEALARRVQEAFDQLPRPRIIQGHAGKIGAGPNGLPAGAQGLPAGADIAPDVETSFPAKFDLGPDLAVEKPARHIPWGYGHDRITAMVVDPEKMFVYWEVTDEAIARARQELGRGGAEAWLNLRVYDVTGRLFDGTNAHGYFDHKLERHDRQWFFDIDRPTSMACVEIGLRSSEGYFVKIVRSGRIEFPRRQPVGGGQVEWLTVRTASGHAGDPVAGAPGGYGSNGVSGGHQGALGGAAGAGPESQRELQIPEWRDGPGDDQIIERRWEWRDGERGEWRSDVESVAWTGPIMRSTWEAGPFAFAVEPPTWIEERTPGKIMTRTDNGLVHIVYGPWQVVIRGLGARAERRVLATWEIFHSWASTVATETTGPTVWRQLPGGSEWVAMGASERSWLFGSELRLGGASEVFFLGASELRLLGASETLYAGASEYRFRGASEWLYAGASERLYAGASERSYAGASERLYAGASERSYAGASERLMAGASEQRGDYPPGVGASEKAPPRQYPERE